MKFTVTALGGARQSLPRVVAGIVAYLHPTVSDTPDTAIPDTPPPPSAPSGPASATGPGGYYTGTGEGPGRWLGTGAASSGLAGTVAAGDLATVLAGRDPATGRRLITARGSAGRRPGLGAGTHTATDAHGRRLYAPADAATMLGLARAEVDQLLAEDRTTGRPRLAVCGHGPDGEPLVAEDDLLDLLDTLDVGSDRDRVLAQGEPTDVLSIGDAASLVGVTPRYLRRAARRYETDRDRIDTAVAEGRKVRHAYLVADRDADGRWTVTRAELAEFVSRRRQPAVRVGFDLTLTTEKSVGILALLTDPATSAAVLDAVRAGNDTGLGWLEARAATVRVNGQAVPAAGFTVASFQHLTSRALDPFPHHHNVLANTATPTAGDSGPRALDARPLYRHARGASAIATAEMRHRLTAALGVRWRPGRHGGWEIDGIDDPAIDEFSRRRNDIDDAVAELEAALGRGAEPGELSGIILRTRPDKDHTPAHQLVAGWLARAQSVGLDPDHLHALTSRTTVPGRPDPDHVFASLAAPEGICAGSSVFTRDDALAALADHPIPGLDGTAQPFTDGAHALEVLADGFLASDHVVALDGDQYTTLEILAHQDHIIAAYHRGRTARTALVTHGDLDAVLADHAQLTDEQRHLVRVWTTSGQRIQAAVGAAGSGKTTTMTAAAQAWTATGHRVLGAAVKGEAARTLAAVGITTETVAWYLAHDDPRHNPLDARTVLIVDEASTLSDRDLSRLIDLTETAGATLRLLGDPHQHGAIDAGGMYRVLTERFPHDTPTLTTSHRLQDPRDRAAADALRHGRIKDALDHLDAAGHLHLTTDELDAHRQVLTRWWTDHQAGHHHPMIERRNHHRRQLNRLARALLRARGHLGSDQLTATDGRQFAVGDHVTARRPARHLHPPGRPHDHVRNGATGTITALRPAGPTPSLTVDFDGIGTVTIPATHLDPGPDQHGRPGLDHAYAITSYAVQGATHPAATARINPDSTPAETYVNTTRGRDANHLYLTPRHLALDGEALPRLPPADADDDIADHLASTAPQPTAWEFLNPVPRSGQAPGRSRNSGLSL